MFLKIFIYNTCSTKQTFFTNIFYDRVVESEFKFCFLIYKFFLAHQHFLQIFFTIASSKTNLNFVF